MSIATAVERLINESERLQNAKESLKAKLIAKGVEVSDEAKLDQYADLVDEIETGITPTGNLNVTANGIYNVKTLETVTVAIPEWDGSSEDIASGYTVTLEDGGSSWAYFDELEYSLNGGSTYTAVSTLPKTLTNVTQIKFRNVNTALGAYSLTSDIITDYIGPVGETRNYEITANLTISVIGISQSGGGYD